MESNFNLEQHKKGFPTPTTAADVLKINSQNEMLKGNTKAIRNFESEFKTRFPQTDK